MRDPESSNVKWLFHVGSTYILHSWTTEMHRVLHNAFPLTFIDLFFFLELSIGNFFFRNVYTHN